MTKHSYGLNSIVYFGIDSSERQYADGFRRKGAGICYEL